MCVQETNVVANSSIHVKRSPIFRPHLQLAVGYVDASRHDGFRVVDALPDVDAYLPVIDVLLDVQSLGGWRRYLIIGPGLPVEQTPIVQLIRSVK